MELEAYMNHSTASQNCTEYALDHLSKHKTDVSVFAICILKYLCKFVKYLFNNKMHYRISGVLRFSMIKLVLAFDF